MGLFKRKNEDDEQPARRRPYHVDSGETIRPKTTFSYYTKRSEDTNNVGRDVDNSYNNPEKSDSLSRKIVRRTVIALFILVVLALVVNNLLLKPEPKIIALTNAKNQIFLGDMSTYQEAANKLFAQVENRNKLTVNTNGISDSMLKQFPELEEVSVTLPVAGHVPTIYIQPSDPALVLQLPDGSSFVLDNSGKAVVSADEHSEDISKAGIPTVQSQNDSVYQVGQTVLPSTTVKFIQIVNQQLAANHIAFAKIVLPNASSELDVYIAGQPYFVKFNTQQDSAAQQSGTFVATYRHLLNKGQLPKQYIDVRIDGRAYYK